MNYLYVLLKLMPFSFKLFKSFDLIFLGDTLFINDCDLSDIHEVISNAYENIIVEVESDAQIQEIIGLKTLNEVCIELINL